MEDQKVIAWFDGSPLMLYTTVADRYALRNGSQITDKALYARIVEENINQSREVCSLEARASDQECLYCGS